jgi:hypothetical protein
LNGVSNSVLQIYRRSLHFSAEREHHNIWYRVGGR